MERRSFLEKVCIASAATILPSALFKKGRGIVFEKTDVDGVGVGISVCDALSNGFFAGQLISVYGPENAINEAFLIHILFYQLIAQRKRVVYISSTGSLKRWEQIYLRRLGFGTAGEMRKALTKSGIIDNLRIIEIYPYEQNWKDYVVQAKEQHPDSILVDDIKFIEGYFREKGLVKQLKLLAAEVQAPVFVHAEIESKRRKRYLEALNLRKDFDQWSDVLISVVPKNVIDFKVDGITVGKRFLLDLKLIGVSCPCALHRSYGGVFPIEFVDYELRFAGL
jgi:hypothetical protein